MLSRMVTTSFSGMVRRISAFTKSARREASLRVNRFAHACANLTRVDLRLKSRPRMERFHPKAGRTPGNSLRIRPRAPVRKREQYGSRYEKFRMRVQTSADTGERVPFFRCGVEISVVFVLRAQEIHGHGRYNGARPHVGSQHGENYRLCAGNEKETYYS